MHCAICGAPLYGIPGRVNLCPKHTNEANAAAAAAPKGGVTDPRNQSNSPLAGIQAMPFAQATHTAATNLMRAAVPAPAQSQHFALEDYPRYRQIMNVVRDLRIKTRGVQGVDETLFEGLQKNIAQLATEGLGTSDSPNAAPVHQEALAVVSPVVNQPSLGELDSPFPIDRAI